MIPFLFLDFDGVLNHAAHFANRRAGRTAADCLTDAESFDLAAVERVNRIVERTGADVVISSSWRCMLGLADIRGILKRHGFRGRVVGATPRLHRTPDGEERVRGHEIQAWIERRERFRGDVGPFAILDDDSDMAHLAPRLVRTSFDLGLLDEHVERVVALIGERAIKPENLK